MNFIEITPLRGKLARADFIRSSFHSSLHRPVLKILVGDNVAKKIGWKDGSRISIAYGVENKKIWKLTINDERGYKLNRSKNPPTHFSKIELVWTIFKPKKCDIGARNMKIIEFIDGGIIVEHISK